MGAIFIHTISFIIKRYSNIVVKTGGERFVKLQLPRPAGKQPAAAQPQPERPQVPLLETDPVKGLTAEQAAQRMAAGLDTHAAASPTRSETEIIRDNIFTFFNLVFIVLALCLALVGSFANMTFLGL